MRGDAHAVIALDLARTAALWDLDETSLLATLGAGTTGPQAEELLSARGYTLGPLSAELRVRLDRRLRRDPLERPGVARLRPVRRPRARPAHRHPGRRAVASARAPASAAGPDLRELFLGSEGAFGVITEVTVRIRPVPAATAYGAWTFADFAAGADALPRTHAARHPPHRPATERRERDPRERADGRAPHARPRRVSRSRRSKGATPRRPDAALGRTDALFRDHGGTSRGEDPARSWERGRFASPALRDTLLDIGVLAETLETATTWANLAALKAAVTDALMASLTADGTKPIVMCHISHVYPAGASLYFTVVAALTDRPGRPVGTGEGCRIPRDRRGGRNDHPPSRGRARPPPVPRGGDRRLGIAILRAVKATVDPRGIMNPGVLVPAPSALADRRPR